MPEVKESFQPEVPKATARKEIPLLLKAGMPIGSVVLLLAAACNRGEKETKIATPIPEVHQPVATQTITAIPSVTETPLIQTTPTVPEPETSPTPQVETAPIPKPTLEFADGIGQQIQDSVRLAIDELPPLGNTRIQLSTLDREGFWPNKDGMPTLEVGVAGFYWQRNFYHGLAHAFDPSLNSEIFRIRTPEQNETIRQAIQKALTDPIWGQNLALDFLYSPTKNIADSHPEAKGKPINPEILNAQIRLRADGAYIGRDSEFPTEFPNGPKADFIFGSQFLDPTPIEQFVQSISRYRGASSMSQFIANRSQLLDQLAASSPFWQIAVSDIRRYASIFDNYDWSEAQISLPRPLPFDDQMNARALLTFGDLVLRDRFLRQDPELTSLLANDQQTAIRTQLDQRINSYREELLAGGLGLVLQFENPQLLAIETQGINIAAETDIEMMRSLTRQTPYYQIFLALSASNS